MEFAVNQIVRGKVAGVFVVLGFEMVANVRHAVLKEVNPKNLTEVARGEMKLPVECLTTY